MKVETVLSATTGGSEDRHQPGRLFVLPRARPELVSSPPIFSSSSLICPNLDGDSSK